MAAKVAVPIPPKLNPTIVKEKSPVPTIKVIATTIKLRVVDKSTLLSTQILAPAAAIKPNTNRQNKTN